VESMEKKAKEIQRLQDEIKFLNRENKPAAPLPSTQPRPALQEIDLSSDHEDTTGPAPTSPRVLRSAVPRELPPVKTWASHGSAEDPVHDIPKLAKDRHPEIAEDDLLPQLNTGMPKSLQDKLRETRARRRKISSDYDGARGNRGVSPALGALGTQDRESRTARPATWASSRRKESPVLSDRRNLPDLRSASTSRDKDSASRASRRATDKDEVRGRPLSTFKRPASPISDLDSPKPTRPTSFRARPASHSDDENDTKPQIDSIKSRFASLRQAVPQETDPNASSVCDLPKERYAAALARLKSKADAMGRDKENVRP
jgi:hypothetical protein